MLLYTTLKTLFRPALRVFYRYPNRPAAKALPETGPLIVVANHPNTLLDPLLVGMLWQRELRFLTSSAFFQGGVGWALRATGCIPVHRPEDRRADAALTEVQRMVRNDAAFRAAYQRLAAGEAVLIFPEGTSEAARGLRPLKSGAARIALGAEARYGWTLGVRLLPVGLNYEDATRFPSAVARHAGPPIQVADYRARYEANPSAAARALAADIRQALAAQVAAVNPPALDALLRALESLSGAAAPTFAGTRALSERLMELATYAPAALAALRHRTAVLIRALHRLGVAPAALAAALPGTAELLARRLALLLAAPLAAWGALHHAAALGLPVLVVRRLRPDVEFSASIRVTVGILTVPGCYALQTALVGWLSGSGVAAVAYLATLPLAGALALAWRRQWAVARGQWGQARLARRRPRLLAALRQERAAVLAAVSGVGEGVEMG